MTVSSMVNSALHWNCNSHSCMEEMLLTAMVYWLKSHPSSEKTTIAAAYHHIMKDDLGKLCIKEDKMRDHLIRCFDKGKLRRFPQTSETEDIQRCKEQYVSVIMSCSRCKKPDSYQE